MATPYLSKQCADDVIESKKVNSFSDALHGGATQLLYIVTLHMVHRRSPDPCNLNYPSVESASSSYSAVEAQLHSVVKKHICSNNLQLSVAF